MLFYNLYNSLRGRLYLFIGGILFVAMFFGIFKPFHMAHYSNSEFRLAYGGLLAITVFSLGISHFIFPKYFKSVFSDLIANSKGRLVWILINLISISSLFFVFKIAFGFYGFTISRVLTGISATVAVGAIPVMFLVFSEGYLKRDRNVEILFVESKGNYLFIHDMEGKVIKNRGTLKEYLSNNNHIVVQSHRAFLVNQNIEWSVEKIGNRYFLLDPCVQHRIPLSREKKKLFT